MPPTPSPQLQLPFAEFTLETLTEKAIETFRTFVPKDGKPYWGCFSGGKDSCVIKELARLAGVPIVWHYNLTTIDPPELVRFIRREHPDVIRHRPKENFFAAVVRKVFPTRRTRWCCALYKESTTPIGERMVFGVRAAESPARAKRWNITSWHSRTKEYVISPIVYWRDEDVWEFIRSRNLPYCSLYDEGWKRLGCIGCPMSGRTGKLRDFARWPRFERLWIRAFRRLWERRSGHLTRDGKQWLGDARWNNADEMWEWWLNESPLPQEEDECQGLLDLLM